MRSVEVIREQGQKHGQIAVSSSGTGPLVLCVPGMGETQAAFRHLMPGLVAAGRTVATMDLRGHGDSSAEFDSYDDVAAAGDVLAVIDALGGAPAVVIGSSMGAAAAVLAAAQRPEAVSALVLIGPFVRDPGGAASRALLRVLLSRPWGPALWGKHYRSLFGESVPADHEHHVMQTLERLRAPERWRAFQQTTRTSHAPAEAVLGEVSQPTLVLMGDKDPDFRVPEAEAVFVAQAVGGRHLLVAGAGHYPMGEQPDIVLDAITNFLAETDA